ncbi:hydrogenobyrinic acid a,c-diamide synthase (glutamine-hydrolyzing) [Candidatus Desantisbacteria bacterium]|nr:hydrogenobyrinic acid a,c-diamide synthase (glutamine-hydrolyzing) [Candidatus Desantisbacteria bacterium]
MRVIISATHRSSGKTTITIGLCAALAQKGLVVQPFKKGPDYIDPMWIGYAAGRDCHNLDIFMMGEDGTFNAFQSAASNADLSIVEGNKGFYDGLDIDGRDSTCHLAQLLKSPVILIVDARGMTRGIAPLLLGYRQFEPDNMIRGVILNMVAGSRHEKKLREAIEHYCGLEVIGVLPATGDIEIKQRHLGLIPIREDNQMVSIVDDIARIVKEHVNLERVIGIAGDAQVLPGIKAEKTSLSPLSPSIRLGVARDQAFTFYYPENLNALCQAGASIIPFNTLTDEHLPAVDGLYFGGGFPEMFLEGLAQNKSLLEDIRAAIKRGMPVYAECGGLMYLSGGISYNGIIREMVGALPCDVEVFAKPQGHGYVIMEQTGDAPWSGFDGQGRGHEFHYSRICNPQGLTFAYNIIRGKGVNGKCDGIVYKNVIAGYVKWLL